MSNASKSTASPHQNTAETIAAGNALLADAKMLRDFGVNLAVMRDDADKASNEAFDAARRKQHEAEVLLTGSSRYGY